MAQFQVTNTFIINTRAKSSEVNQNFTDVLAILQAHHHDPNIYTAASPITTSGIADNAQIKDTQLALFTRAGLIAQPGVITAAAIAGLVQVKYGGTGTDGALSISSGTTTLDFGSALYLIKNYTSISITGTAVLTASNPNNNGSILMLKATGNVTITSSATRAIDLRSMGGLAGAANANGTDGVSTGAIPTGGVHNAYGTATYSATVGGYIMAMMRSGRGVYASSVPSKNPVVFAGAGGSGGDHHSQTGGAGGRGGGGLYIECVGNLNITSTFDVSGAAGSNGSGNTGSGVYGSGGRGGGGWFDSAVPDSTLTSGGAGGGGGGGGAIVISYNGTLTANTATFTVAGGAKGVAGSAEDGTDGGAGYSLVIYNSEAT